MTTSNYPDNPTVASLGDDVGSTAAGAPASGAKDQAKQQGKQVAGTAADQGKQVAGTAADQGKQVAGVAQDEARKIASEATSQARGLLDETTTQLEEQGRGQRDRLVQVLKSFGDDLEQMASQGNSGMASDLARQLAGRARGLSSSLDGREPRELLDDARSFARRKPGAFLGSALVAGVVAGRLARGAKDAQDSSSSSSYRTPSAATYSTATPRPGYVSDSSMQGFSTDPSDPLADVRHDSLGHPPIGEGRR